MAPKDRATVSGKFSWFLPEHNQMNLGNLIASGLNVLAGLNHGSVNISNPLGQWIGRRFCKFGQHLANSRISECCRGMPYPVAVVKKRTEARYYAIKVETNFQPNQRTAHTFLIDTV